MNIFDPIVTGSLIVSGSEQITGNLSVSGTIYGNIAGTVAGGAGTGSNTFIGTQIISGNVFTSGTLGVNTPSNNGFQVYISTSINDGTLGLDAQPSAGNVNAMYFLKGGSKKFEISMDTSATPIFRLLPYTSSGFFEIGNPSNSGTDYSVVLESTYGNVLLGPGISNATGQISGATPSLHKVQINGSMFVSGSVTANSFTGSLLGTASYVTASNVFGTVTNASTASFVTSSNIFGAVTNAVTASFITGSGVIGNISGNAATSTTASYVSGANVGGNITGNSNNITAYTINQNLGTGNTVNFAGLSLSGSLNVNNLTNNITGSLVISQNLTVLGSSSITYTTASQLNVANNLITVNNSTPGVRFAGLAAIDSGSNPPVSGSLLFDSINNQWIFLHQFQSGAAITSSVLITGPETSNNLGNETALTQNRLPKIGNPFHIIDSNTSDDGTTIRHLTNTEVTGSLKVTTNITAVGFTGSGASLTSIPNGALVNSAITIGSTSTSLGGTSTSLAGLTSVSSTAFTGSLQGTASTASFVTGSNVFGNISGNAGTATTLQTARNIQGVSFNGSADITVVTAGTGISVSGTSVTNTGTLTVTGTANQVLVNGGTAAANGNLTLSLPQSIATTSSPSFAGATLTNDLVINESTQQSIIFQTSGASKWNLANSVGNSYFQIYNYTTSATALTIANSNSAATFASSVTATSFIGGGSGLTSLPTNTALYPTLNQNTTGTASNITAYTINQSVGTGNSPTFANVYSNGLLYAGYASVASTAGTDLGLNIYAGSDSSGYGRIRFYFNGTNQSTIHAFSNSWSTNFSSGSRGAININGYNGVTFGNWNAPAGYIDNSGNSYFASTMTVNGILQPNTTGTFTLGTSSLRWSTIYTNDLSLKNDYGDYTIVEGEENLYLYNNKSGKVFTFNLTEVDPATAPPKKYND